MERYLLPPADDAASDVLLLVQTATTQVKQLVTEGVSHGVPQEELVAQLNAAISSVCREIADVGLREQVKKSLVTAARKWHYELSNTYKVFETSLRQEAARQPMNIELTNLLAKTPYEKQIEFRKILDDGTNPGIPVIREYQKGVKFAVKALAADTPKVITTRRGKAYVMPVRLRAEMAVRYAAAVEDLQRLVSEGALFCWISSHASCSPRCADFQGKLYSLFHKKAVLDGKEYGESGTIDGIPYRPINEALAGKNWDGNGCISGYNCRHRAVEYKRGSRPPQDFTEATMRREYAVDKQQRAYENQIRHLKQAEKQLRACGMDREASKIRKKWRLLTLEYQEYSISHDRAYYPYRCVIDAEEAEETFRLTSVLKRARKKGNKKAARALTKYKNQFIMELEELRQPDDFVLAHTVQEAEAYMARRATRVSYSGIRNIKTLNQINRTFGYLFEKYALEPLVLVNTNPQEKGVWAEATGRSLHVSKSFANEPVDETFIRSTVKWQPYCLDELNASEKRVKECLGELDAIPFSEGETRKKKVDEIKKLERVIVELTENLRYFRHNVTYPDREVESIIAHEVGHIIAEQRYQQLSMPNARGGFAERVSEVMHRAMKNGDIYKISQYASTDVREFFAECFVIYEFEEEILPDYILELMEEALT